MRTSVILIPPPAFDRLLRVRQAGEPLGAQAFLSEPAVKAFDERVLNRLARTNELESYAVTVSPEIERSPRELRTVVADNASRKTPSDCQTIQHLNDSKSRQRSRDFDRGTFSRQIVDEREAAELSTVGQCIRDEVHAPSLVRYTGSRQRHARHRDPLLSSSASHCQAFLAVKPQDQLVIYHPAFPLEQDVKPLVPPAGGLIPASSRKRSLRSSWLDLRSL